LPTSHRLQQNLKRHLTDDREHPPLLSSFSQMHDEAAVFADARLTLAADDWRSNPRRVRRLPLRR
jgi:hypothetical protein